MLRYLLWFLLMLCIAKLAFGQQDQQLSPNWRLKLIPTKPDTIKLDTLSIIPQSIKINDQSAKFSVDFAKALLIWRKRPSQDSVLVSYRVFSFLLAQEYYHKNPAQQYNNMVVTPYHANGNEENFIDFGGLDYSGSFGRGISFGNNQDVVVNSNLNLQMAGYLGDSIQLKAAITDNNIPFQPEGNTQTLQDFDKVYIEFSKKQNTLTLGDFSLQPENSRFMNFYKRLQGVKFSTVINDNKSAHHITASGAVARGKFARNSFDGEEGNQGPYHLQGAEGEQYFIILAGTERVYLDGELLQRGEDRDYIIDYNTAEITFTPKRLITKDSRIQVEFEYANRDYLNSQLYAADAWQVNKKLTININAYSSQDAKNSSLSQVLDARQRHFLSQVGDSVQNALYPSAVKDTFSTSKILYKLTDTTANGHYYDSVYVYSTNPDSARYSLSYSFVGNSQGNYITADNAANGKVYQWVAPVNGQPQGSYEPVILLIAPKKQQLLTVGAQYEVNEHTNVQTEVALSNYDVNTFSALSNNDNKGLAARIAINNSKPLDNHPQPLVLHTSASYEYVGKTFQPLERIRDVEFYRDWSVDSSLLKAMDEHLADLSLSLEKSDIGNVAYQLSSYIRGKDYKGWRNVLSSVINKNGWTLNGELNLTSGNGSTYRTDFFRPHFLISRQFRKLADITLGSRYSLEHNAEKDQLADTLTRNSFAFHTLEFFMNTDETQPNNFGINIAFRTDQAPLPKSFEKVDHSQTITVHGQLMKNTRHRLSWNVIYHNLLIDDSLHTAEQADKGLVGRVEYAINELNGFITGATLYELGSGQEPKLEYTYVEVPAGEGDYTWNDYNKDGLQQLNEFEKAVFQDEARYIRILTSSNDYIKTNYVNFSQSLNLSPQHLWTRDQLTSFRRFLSRFTSQSGIQINRKVEAKNLSQFNPFQADINDSALIAVDEHLTNSLFFNRLSSIWSISYTNTLSKNKALLTYGYESRAVNTNIINGLVNISRSFSINLKSTSGSNQLLSPAFKERNFNFNFLTFEPAVIYTKAADFRLSLGYVYGNKQNKAIYGGERALNNALDAELKYNVFESGTLNAGFTFNNINFKGDANSTLGYTMLDGLLPGKNYLWNISLDKKIGKYLQLNLQYDGRKTGEARIIHTGRASVRAVF